MSPRRNYSRHAAPVVLAGLVIAMLTACGTTAGTAGDATSAESTDSALGGNSLDCDETKAVDQAVCDDLTEAKTEDGDPSCELADGSAVWTLPLAQYPPDDQAIRCAVPDEKALFEALSTYGGQIDGIADLGTEGNADYNIFYLVRGGCFGEPTYWPATANWSTAKGTSPYLTAERFGTAQEVVDAICA